jgi:hypothetical protein
MAKMRYFRGTGMIFPRLVFKKKEVFLSTTPLKFVYRHFRARFLTFTSFAGF